MIPVVDGAAKPWIFVRAATSASMTARFVEIYGVSLLYKRYSSSQASYASSDDMRPGHVQ